MALKNLADFADEVVQAGAPATPPVSDRRLRPAAAPSRLIQETREVLDLQAEIDSLKKAAAQGVKLKLSSLRRSRFQTEPLDEARVQALVDNLGKNPLNSPIIVREIEPGVYELVAGHHRVEAYRRLGIEEIDALVRNYDDDAAERLGLYDNLLAPTLSDFSKYQGFARRRESKGLSYDQLAEEAGMSKAWVGALMTFDKLPPPALELIRQSPHALGASAARALAPFCERDPAKVTECVARIIAGTLPQTKAAAWMARPAQEAVAPPARREVLIKAGKQRYAVLTCRAATLTLKVQSPEEAARLMKLLEPLLREQASQKP